mmetsp:Transcript_27071/g.37688  ORF Transcript_27071/g.37688 Transcript_27071/m.37688 type:complete len:362 (-) Transcript_27071:290-1375(-)|eukprot:CAMPEP_0184488010 /NCGR_PEP_ID=MMETSP0113_2-20130426/10474_1 /TAXON_ID=91329 /ORGANISM="Norrisiella sphaerica, Strain BC52" /LENGTH=361 /DNA_ID=CAMNT_0026870471 /DNA_START=159 /DNA_END=1244 /DNA_ORIENTATION=+
MGVCSSEQQQPSVEEQQEAVSSQNVVLLIGPAGSGKSTLCKQLSLSYGMGFSDEDKKAFRNIIRVRVLEYMQQLIQESKTLPKEDDEEELKNEATWNQETEELAAIVLQQDPYVEGVNPLAGIRAIREKIEILWKEPVIINAYNRRHQFKKKFNENGAHFLDRVTEIADEKYDPPMEDILRCRQRTVGHEELKFTLSDIDFCIYDLGGQWDERRNWQPFLEQADSLVFVVDMGAYDESLAEDPKRNRMEDALTLFERICDLSITRRKPIVLFLNKMDVFQKKIEHIPISVCNAFTEYDGPADSEEDAKDFISNIFLVKNKHKRTIMRHFLCALDTEAVNKIFQSTMLSVIQNSLEQGGLLK